MKGDNYMSLIRKTSTHRWFMFIDCEERYADRIFIQNKFRVYFHGDYKAKGEKYMPIMCSVRKKDVGKFIESMDALTNKMLLMGYTDYKEWCVDFLHKIETTKI